MDIRENIAACKLFPCVSDEDFEEANDAESCVYLHREHYADAHGVFYFRGVQRNVSY